MIWFNPTDAWLKWLTKTIGMRVLLEIGCGKRAPLLRRLIALGQRNLIGFDPQLDLDTIGFLMAANCHGLALEAERLERILAIEAVVLFARPSHDGLVSNVLPLLHAKSLILYVSKPENVQLDVPAWVTAKRLKAPKLSAETTYQLICKTSCRQR